VHVQKLSLSTFTQDGDPITITGAMEGKHPHQTLVSPASRKPDTIHAASGLVAQNDGFALLTHLNTTDPDPEEYFTPTLLRYRNASLAWSTPLGGKTVTFQMFPDTKFRANKGSLDGDLAYGENGTYAAFFRAEYYGGTAAGHGGDSIVYVDDSGARIEGPYSQTQHCGHNFGLALSTSKDIPFPAICTSDSGDVSIASSLEGEMPAVGPKRVGEMFAAEAFGGTRGSYSGMARMGMKEEYTLVWVARPEGAADDHVTRHVEVAHLGSKDSVDAGPLLVTELREGVDCFNAHVAGIDVVSVLVTWEENDISACKDFGGYGCEESKYTGTQFQFVDTSSGESSAFASTDVFVSGDIAKVGSKLCWPYVNFQWSSSKSVVDEENIVKKMSFACYNN